MCDISVLIPVYNGELTIKRCIDSVLSQSYKDINVIVGDDGSTDATLNILKEYKDITIYKRKKTTIGSMRNFLIKKCKTKYFLFVDADDYLGKDCISILYKEMLESDCDFVMGSVDYSVNRKIVLDDKNKYAFLFMNDISYFVTCWNKLYKKELFSNIFYPDFSLAEDEFVIHHLLAKCHKIVILPYRTYFYSDTVGGLSKKVIENYEQAIFAFEDRYSYFFQTIYEKKMYEKYTNYLIDIFCLLKEKRLDTTKVYFTYKKVFLYKYVTMKYLVFRFLPLLLYYYRWIRRR